MKKNQGSMAMFRISAATVMLAALAFAGATPSYADMNGMQRSRPHSSECRFGPFGHCAGSDRDFLVDKLYRYSCNEARNILLHRGFNRVKTVSCSGMNFRFSARWKGENYAVRVSRSTGDVVSMKRVN
jgi:hypothetical protein